MKLRTLVLEGDKEAEKRLREAHPPARNKEEYLLRKRRQSQLPLFDRSFYLCRMAEEELKGIDLDGSRKVTICAHQNRFHPTEKKYIRDEGQHISIYYLEREQIEAIQTAADRDADAQVLPGILRDALLDIARRNDRPGAVPERIEAAFAHMAENGFAREERVARLSKRSGDTGLTAEVWRVLSGETGEGWYVRLLDGEGNLLRRETMGGGRYTNRLGSGLYARAEWRGTAFVVLERFGKEVFRLEARADL